MLLTVSRNGEAVAVIAGAYTVQEGTRLRCPLLLIHYGTCQSGQVLTFCTPTNQEIRVKLPEWPDDHKGHLRFEKEELEVVYGTD